MGSTIADNTSQAQRGKIDTLLAVTQSTVCGNSSVSHGGGIYSSASLTLDPSTISSNSASGSGGGISSNTAPAVAWQAAVDEWRSAAQRQVVAVAPSLDLDELMLAEMAAEGSCSVKRRIATGSEQQDAPGLERPSAPEGRAESSPSAIPPRPTASR